MTRPIVVFDLDGTLIDTAPDILESLNHVLDRKGLRPIPSDNLRGHIGHGGRAMLRRAHVDQDHPLSEAALDQAMAEFIDHYTAGMPGHSKAFDGVASCLTNLAEAGYALAVCTNKREAPSKRLLSLLQVDAHFAAICGADTFPVRKPDPGHLTGTIKQAAGDPTRAVMIGDSETDIATAKLANIPVVAVDFGYATQPLTDLDPDRIISHFDELTVEMVAELINR